MQQLEQVSGLQICKSANLQICKFANLQTCRFADLQICRFAGLQICRSANLQICRFADLQNLQICSKHIQQEGTYRGGFRNPSRSVRGRIPPVGIPSTVHGRNSGDRNPPVAKVRPSMGRKVPSVSQTDGIFLSMDGFESVRTELIRSGLN